MDDRAPTPDPDGAGLSAPPGGRQAAHAADAAVAVADEARRRLREQGIVPIEPDGRIGPLLEPDELLLAVRHSTFLDRRQPRRDDAPGLRGDLYITTRRVVHLGRQRVAYGLDEIREADVAAGQLLLVVGENRGVALDVADPGLLRVEIAAARAAAREKGRALDRPAIAPG